MGTGNGYCTSVQVAANATNNTNRSRWSFETPSRERSARIEATPAATTTGVSITTENHTPD